MGKLSYAQGRELVESGLISEEALQQMIEDKKVGNPRTARSAGPKRVFPGTEVTPVLYFKGGKGVDPTSEMTELRLAFEKLVKKYTSLA